jgi:hypothetical protein
MVGMGSAIEMEVLVRAACHPLVVDPLATETLVLVLAPRELVQQVAALR